MKNIINVATVVKAMVLENAKAAGLVEPKVVEAIVGRDRTIYLLEGEGGKRYWIEAVDGAER